MNNAELEFFVLKRFPSGVGMLGEQVAAEKGDPLRGHSMGGCTESVRSSLVLMVRR